MDTLHFQTAHWVTKVYPAGVDKRHERDSSVSAFKVVSTPAGIFQFCSIIADRHSY